MVELLEIGFMFGTAVVALFMVFGLSNYYLKTALNKAQKVQVLEQLFKQLNIKDFKVTDLNSDKLDEKGFLRLLTMLQTLYASKATATSGMAGLAELQLQVNEFIKGLRTLGAEPGKQGPGVEV